MKAETLRKSILQYAIQGKLVSQIATEEPASVLLEKIKAEKQELIKQGKIKKEKSLPSITEDEKPFDIPDSWEWVRLSDVAILFTGNSINAHEKKKKYTGLNEGYNYIATKDVYFDNTIDYNNGIKIPFDTDFKIAKNASSLLCIEGGSAGRKVGVLNQDVCFGNKLCSFEPIMIDYMFLFYFLQSPVFTENFTDNKSGMIGGVGVNTLKTLAFTLPPLSEQKRIIARIEELMALVDDYETREIELSLLEKEFPEKLKKSILQYAIQSKLVPQIEMDEPASMLLEKIKIEKHELIKQGKIKKEKLLPPITENEKPFDIPDSWEWVRLGDLAEYKKGPFGSSLTKAMFVEKSSSTVKVYEQKNAIKKDYCLGDYYITQEKFETMQGFIACAGDIIVSCAGTIGETYILPDNAPTGIINQALMRIRIHNQDIVDYYLLYFDYIVTVAAKLGGNGSAIKNIPPLDELKNLLIPVPPIQEQKRIIERLKYIYTLIDIIASGKRLKKFNNDEIKPTITAKVFKLPIKENKPKVDVASLGMVARADSGVTQDDVNDMLRQVQSFYDKKN